LSRVILDEGVPRQVGDHLPRHSVTTVPIEISIRDIEESAWKVKVGDAMVRAESERCPVW
jgi:hypothetical protein